MKKLSLQLVTLSLDDGSRGIFIGGPLVNEQAKRDGRLIEDIWFSQIQNLPSDLTLAQLIEWVEEQTLPSATPATVQ